mmetsp:Transcript_9994/g.30869  ORF Transcript_9994/g.30869 Transcript_9994/m.30869 type:complete len:212 (+) Transcript_9994:575-1210(+)
MRAQFEHTRGLFRDGPGAPEERRSPLATAGALRVCSEPPSPLGTRGSPVREAAPEQLAGSPDRPSPRPAPSPAQTRRPSFAPEPAAPGTPRASPTRPGWQDAAWGAAPEWVAAPSGSPSLQRVSSPTSQRQSRAPELEGEGVSSARSPPVWGEMPAVCSGAPVADLPAAPPDGDMFAADEADNELIAWSLGLKMEDIGAEDSLLSGLKNLI